MRVARPVGLGVCWLGLLILIAPVRAEVTIRINNVDAAEVGLNDPTPVSPVGGNPGRTLGEQRLNVLRRAAELWGGLLEGDVDIVIQATFQPLPCSPTTAVLGAAGPIRVFANFPATSIDADTWYPAALANQLAGFDLHPGRAAAELLKPPFQDDIVVYFNGDLDGNGACLPGDWYYGFDTAPAAGDIALLNVAMHEFAHGLGLTSLIDETSGQTPLDLPDRYAVFSLNTTTDRHFHEMNAEELLDAQVSHDHIVWDGPATTHAAREILDWQAELIVEAPASLAGTYPVTRADFGPAPGVDAEYVGVELVNDRIGDTTDGCEPLEQKLRGRIAFINRGNCPFALKVAHAEAAGASAVVIRNTAPGGALIMDAPHSRSRIPAVSISHHHGDTLLAALPRADVRAALSLNPERLVGADPNGFVRLYAPDPVEPGSSIAHIDPGASPDLLMEPFLSADLDAANDVDLTPYLLQDLGWRLAEETDESD